MVNPLLSLLLRQLRASFVIKTEKERGLGPRQEMKELPTLFFFSSLQAPSLPLLKQRKPRVQELPVEEAILFCRSILVFLC